MSHGYSPQDRPGADIGTTKHKMRNVEENALFPFAKRSRDFSKKSPMPIHESTGDML